MYYFSLEAPDQYLLMLIYSLLSSTSYIREGGYHSRVQLVGPGWNKYFEAMFGFRLDLASLQ